MRTGLLCLVLAGLFVRVTLVETGSGPLGVAVGFGVALFLFNPLVRPHDNA